jgi:membrane fusion protein, multidrug efflux system
LHPDMARTPATRTEASHGRSDGPAGRPSLSHRTARHVLRRWMPSALLLLPVGLIVGGLWYITDVPFILMDDADDAYVQAERVGISTDVSGVVKEVDVTENQHVEAGDVLYRLDELPFRLALERAEAQLGTVRNDLTALKANYQYMQVLIKQAQRDADFCAAEFHRAPSLPNAQVPSQQVPSQQVPSRADATSQNLGNARQKLASLNQQLAAIATKLSGDPNIPVERHSLYLDAKVQRDEAARRLARSVVKAPFAGIVTNVSSIVPGKYLRASMPALYLIATDRVLVDANP